jgi:hypothetical protein
LSYTFPKRGKTITTKRRGTDLQKSDPARTASLPDSNDANTDRECNTAHNETTIAVNLTDALNSSSGANDDHMRASNARKTVSHTR